jgi:hypothetical protein
MTAGLDSVSRLRVHESNSLQMMTNLFDLADRAARIP